MGTELYQLYDGTIHLWGRKNLWHRIPIDEEKIQVSSQEERSYFHLLQLSPIASSSTASIEGRELRKQSRNRNANRNNDCNKLNFDLIREMAVDISPYCDTLATVDQKRDCHTNLTRLYDDAMALLLCEGLILPKASVKMLFVLLDH
jgi:hypothetical protein